ncbi:hypothetical protein FGK60_43890 [Streptomyces sp. DASNCL29]|nr:hypothetical protein FGK60_43890 [Streptomyces sp. DASNCL29]
MCRPGPRAALDCRACATSGQAGPAHPGHLDGGGSTAMAVNGHLVNVTSDATGERTVGDTVQVVP